MSADPRQLKILKKRVDINREEKERYRKYEAWLYGRVTEVNTAPPTARTSFFCDECIADFDAIGRKEIRMPQGFVWHAYYRAVCPKGHTAIRYITDRLGDPYFFKSFIVRKEQGKYADEFLTPSHPRFKLLYPEAWMKLSL